MWLCDIISCYALTWKLYQCITIRVGECFVWRVWVFRNICMLSMLSSWCLIFELWLVKLRPVLKIILLGVTWPYDSKTTIWPYGIGKKWKIHLNNFFMLKLCLNLSFDWCYALTSCTMHRYSLNFGSIKSFSDIEISAYLCFLHCMGQIGLLVGVTMYGDLYYWMTFKPHADMIICRLRNIC